MNKLSMNMAAIGRNAFPFGEGGRRPEEVKEQPLPPPSGCTLPKGEGKGCVYYSPDGCLYLLCLKIDFPAHTNSPFSSTSMIRSCAPVAAEQNTNAFRPSGVTQR